MATYPTVDTDISGYRAEIHGDSMSLPPLLLWGIHPDFATARDRARRVAKALAAAGEGGVFPHVGYSGEKPRDFPRNGVRVGRDGGAPL